MQRRWSNRRRTQSRCPVAVQRQSSGFQLCNREQIPHRSEAAVHRQGRQHPRRGPVTNPSPESSEGDRDSTGSVPDKMADVTVVPVHSCTSGKGRPRSQSCSLYSKTRRSLSPDAQSREIGEHTCPPGLKHLVEKVETNTAMLKTMLLHSDE